MDFAKELKNLWNFGILMTLIMISDLTSDPRSLENVEIRGIILTIQPTAL